MKAPRKYTLELSGPQVTALVHILKQIDFSKQRNPWRGTKLRPGPNHTTWTETRVAAFRALRKRGCNAKSIADEMGLSKSTVYRRIQQEKDIARAEADTALMRAVTPRPYSHPIYDATLHMKDETQ